MQVKVPDIGDFTDVPVIEIHVKPGDEVAPEDPLVTLESDKATMDVPAPVAGKVAEVLVAIDDKVSEGSAILELEASEAEAEGEAEEADDVPRSSIPDPRESEPEPEPEERGAKSEERAPAAPPEGKRVLVIGSGVGGYTAAFRAADLGLEVTLVERDERLGGVCLNVGCIPSKALLHAAAVIDEAEAMAAHGVSFGKPKIELDKLRDFKGKVVGKLTGGLASMAKQRKVRTVEGIGTFVSPHEMEVRTSDGAKLIRFEHAIIAAGSQSVKLPSFPWDDERIVDSTGALELKDVPKKLLVVGGGIIGLEMTTVYVEIGRASCRDRVL